MVVGWMKQWKIPKKIYRNLTYLNDNIIMGSIMKLFIKLQTQDLGGTKVVG